MPSHAELTGLDERLLQQISEQHQLHQQVIPAFNQLKAAMAKDGIELAVVSAWRSFAQQARIWQAKCAGERPVYNLQQDKVDITHLDGLAKLEAIMLYSALPGASRHHWGTDLDIYDAAAVPQSYRPALLTAEYRTGGPFYKLSLWLERYAADFNFFLPYQHYQGGIAAEPWHISYAPVAASYQAALTEEMLTTVWQQHPIAELAAVQQHLAQLFPRFITNICETKV